MDYMCFDQTVDISTLNGSSLKLVDRFIYLRSSDSSTGKDINMRLAKAWTAIDKLSIIRKSKLSDRIKRSFFQAAVVSILQYENTTWTLTKCMEKNLGNNYTRILWVILNKSWRQHPTKQQLYGYLLSIMKTIQLRWARHKGHCWRSKDELISDILPWTITWMSKSKDDQLCVDTGCGLEDLPGAMDDRVWWWARVREICAGSTWWLYICMYMYIYKPKLSTWEILC